MDMTSKDDVNFVVAKPALKYYSHAFPLHEMSIITIVHWDVHQDNKPRSLLPVHPFHLFCKPPPLRCIFYWHDMEENQKNVKTIQLESLSI